MCDEDWDDDCSVKYGAIHNCFYQKLSQFDKYTARLKKINIKAHVNGSEAEICVKQRYVNPELRTVRDVSFYYAIGETEKLVEVQVNVDGKIFKDTVRAIEEDSIKMSKSQSTSFPYHDIVISMKDRLKGRMLSKIVIDELKQKAAVVCTIKYETEAYFDQENLSTRLIIPTTLVPDRRAPERYLINDPCMDENYNPYVEIPMEIEVTGLAKGKVKYISSPSHIIKSMEQNPSDGTITVMTSLPGTDPTEIENDFIVDIDWISPNEARETLTSLQGADSECKHPLEEVAINVRMINFIAEICAKLRYVNKSKEPVTVTCHRFPIEQGAAVVEFTAQIDGEWVKTEIQDRVKAKQEMQEAETPAILLEQLNQDTLGISINNLGPNTEVIVSIKYVIELPVNEIWVPQDPRKERKGPKIVKGGSTCQGDVHGTVTRLMIPATIFPAVPLKIEVIIIMDNKIKSISSPSHNIASEKQEISTEGTFVMKTSLSGKEIEQTDNDMFLVVECDNPKIPIIFVEKSHDDKDEDTMVAVSFVPSFDLQPTAKEKIFLLDKSSKTDTETSNYSQQNASISVQRLIFSYQLIEQGGGRPSLMISKNCFFNVVRYGKFSTAVFPNGSEPYNRETMEKAIGVIEVGCRDMGANNLGAVLEHTLQQSPKNGLPRQLILFIRGKVANVDFILDLVRQHAHNTTVFCVGQGATVSKSFVRKIARAGGGTSHFMASLREEKGSVKRQLSKDAFCPELKGMRISWQDCSDMVLNGWDNFDDTETFASISPTHKGDRLLVYGKFPASQIPATITAESQDSSSKDVIQIPIEKTSQLSANILHRLVAGKLIRDLEKQGFGSEDMKERIMESALKSQLVSKFTSFVGKKTFN